MSHLLRVVDQTAETSLETYAAVAGHTSDLWEVTVTQAGTSLNSPVLFNTRPATAPTGINGDSNHWTQISCDFAEGPVTVICELLTGNVTTATIRPTRKAITASVNTVTDVVTFTVTEVGQYYVDIGNDANPLFIFVSELDDDVPVVNGTTVKAFTNAAMSLSGVTALVFEPGIHNLDPNYVGTPNDYDVNFGVHVYIKGGAWVDGAILVGGGSGAFKLRGRGTLSGAIYNSEAGTVSCKLLEAPAAGSGSVVAEGITFSDPPSHIFVSNDNDITASDLKFFGFHATSDGIRLGTGSTLADSFFKTNDDQIKLYGSNITVNRIVSWMQASGCLIQLSWNQSSNNTNNTVSTVDIIGNNRTTGTYLQTINNSVVGSRNLNGGNFTNMTFDDFRVEVPVFQLWGFALAWDITGFDDGLGSISSLTFSDWVIAGTSYTREYFNGNGTSPGTITGFTFTNCTVNGSALTTSNMSAAGGANLATFTFN
jgi:hypothetical protein